MINVSCLRMFVVGSSNVSDVGFFTKLPKFPPPAVVEHIDVHLVLRVVDIHGGKSRRTHNRQRFVVCRDKNIYMRPVFYAFRQWERRSAERTDSLNVSQEQNDESVEFRRK